MKYSEIKELVKKFRNNPTIHEEKLWQYLRKKQLNGYQFYRQHAIIYESHGFEHFFYVPDFYCSAKKLAVELDGKIHDNSLERDKIRDERLNYMGIRVIRIRNEELSNIQNVIDKIKVYL